MGNITYLPTYIRTYIHTYIPTYIHNINKEGCSDREQLIVLNPSHLPLARIENVLFSIRACVLQWSQCCLFCSLSDPWLTSVVLNYLRNGLFIDMHQLYKVARIENVLFSIRAMAWIGHKKDRGGLCTYPKPARFIILKQQKKFQLYVRTLCTLMHKNVLLQ